MQLPGRFEQANVVPNLTPKEIRYRRGRRMRLGLGPTRPEHLSKEYNDEPKFTLYPRDGDPRFSDLWGLTVLTII